MDAMAEGIRRIDATTATYSEFADVMEKNQPVSACKCVARLCRTAVVYTLQSAVAMTIHSSRTGSTPSEERHASSASPPIFAVVSKQVLRAILSRLAMHYMHLLAHLRFFPGGFPALYTPTGYSIWLRQSSPILPTVAKGRQSGRQLLATRVRRHGSPGAAPVQQIADRPDTGGVLHRLCGILREACISSHRFLRAAEQDERTRANPI